MSSNKSPKSKSLADVNNLSAAQLESSKPESIRSENKPGLGWLPWVKNSPKKYPTIGRCSPMSGKGTGEAPKSSPGGQENSEMPLPCTRNLHISNSGRFKNKSQMRSRIMSLDSTTFDPPPPTVNRGSVSVDPTNVKGIAYPATPVDFDRLTSKQQQQQLKINNTKSPKCDSRSPKKACGNFDIRLSSKPPSDLCTRKTGPPVVSLAGVETSATHL